MKFFKKGVTGDGVDLLVLVVAQGVKLAHHHEPGLMIQGCEKLQQRV